MPSLTCTNPPCRRSVPVPAGATPGVAYEERADRRQSIEEELVIHALGEMQAAE